jgi:regulator of sigma D
LVPEAWELGQALVDARQYLEPRHQAAYQEYDRLAKKDKETLRLARLEKILGAIENNLEQIPELKDRLKALVKEWQ